MVFRFHPAISDILRASLSVGTDCLDDDKNNYQDSHGLGDRSGNYRRCNRGGVELVCSFAPFAH